MKDVLILSGRELYCLEGYNKFKQKVTGALAQRLKALGADLTKPIEIRDSAVDGTTSVVYETLPHLDLSDMD